MSKILDRGRTKINIGSPALPAEGAGLEQARHAVERHELAAMLNDTGNIDAGGFEGLLAL